MNMMSRVIISFIACLLGFLFGCYYTRKKYKENENYEIQEINFQNLKTSKKEVEDKQNLKKMEEDLRKRLWGDIEQ